MLEQGGTTLGMREMEAEAEIESRLNRRQKSSSTPSTAPGQSATIWWVSRPASCAVVKSAKGLDVRGQATTPASFPRSPF